MRLVLAGLLLVALATPAAAQTADTPESLQQVYACAQISGEAERLACYDAAVGRMREAQTRGDLVAVDRVQAQEIGRDSFGFSLPSVTRMLGINDSENMPDRMEFEVAQVNFRRDGKVALTMTNGQVWEQVDGAPPRRIRAGIPVTVRRAAMGSFLMTLPSGPALRVRRSE